MNVIKLAIVGTGGMTHSHAKAFSAIQEHSIYGL
jgi:predicted dehydrogenase